MTKKLAEWASEQGQITKIRPSDASRGKAIPTVVQFGYDRHKSEGYLGNVGLNRWGHQQQFVHRLPEPRSASLVRKISPQFQ